MGRVRPFTEDDIPRVVELNTKLFPGSALLSPETQRSNFREICLRNPWYNEGICSLVYADNNERVIGFLGVIPRVMVWGDRTITAAMVQHLMVDPESHSPFTGIELFRALFSGAQDLSISDMSSDIGRKSWERCGGSTAFVYSTYWKRPLRPMSFAALQLWKRDRLPTFTKILETAFRGLDAFTKKLPITSLRQPAPHTVGKEFDVEELLEYLSVFASKYSLRPHYDERSLGWLLDTLFRQHRWGSLQKVGVYNQHDKLLGWYIYYLNTTRPSQVLQIGARENTIDQVLEHLFYHAWERGAVEIEGRLNPHFMKAFYRKFSFVFPGRDWMLVHSKNPELLQSVFRADAWLTRLEGDLWLL